MQAAASVSAGLFGGVLVDKMKHHHTMIRADLMRCALVLMLPILIASTVPPRWTGARHV
jgi:hypothetical protein